MNRNYPRVAALLLVVCLVVAPASLGAPARDRDTISSPYERVTRVIKKVKSFFRGITLDDDWTPPKP